MQVKNLSIREQIIEVSRKMFLEYSYKNVAMSKIAKEVHTAVGNLYTYFSRKDVLLDPKSRKMYTQNLSG